mgnify:CR=1 FL=1
MEFELLDQIVFAAYVLLIICISLWFLEERENLQKIVLLRVNHYPGGR